MASATTILLSDDSSLTKAVRDVVEQIRGCRFCSFAKTEEMLQEICSEDVGVVIYHLSDDSDESAVTTLLGAFQADGKTTATLVVSETYSPEQTLRLLRQGAVDCLYRPLDLRRLGFLVDSLTLRARFEPVLKSPQEAQLPDVQISDEEESFYYCSPELVRLMKRVRQVAAHDTSILVTGETGSGKTRLARMIHRLSPRRDEPFMVVNCGTLPEHLIESELFGHRKGSFTGAAGDREGKFAAAAQGTLLLDEVDALPLAAQVKLLRAVDERVFEAVGSNDAQQLHARLIVASNQNLEQEVDAGRFRSDLYFRLNVVEFRLPPLRKCRTAVRPLAERFLHELAVRNNRLPPVLAPEALQRMETYSWPGNIRELRNALERAFAFCSQNEIRLSDLPERLQPRADVSPVGSLSTGRLLDAQSPSNNGNSARPAEEYDEASNNHWPTESDLTDSAILRHVPHLSGLGVARVKGEVRRIVEVLQRTGNNRSKAARELGISRVALYKKLHKYGLMNAGES